MVKTISRLMCVGLVSAFASCGGSGTQTAPQALNIASPVPPDGTVGTLYGGTQGFVFSASGGTTPYAWNWAAAPGSSLPPGLSLSANTGNISGTPVSQGVYTFTVNVRDSASPADQASLTYTISVIDPAPLVITSPNPPDAVVGTPYGGPSGFSLTASGGVAPYTWNWAAMGGSSLPPGLTLSPSTGFISGTATTTGLYSFTVTISDADSSPAQLTVNYSINVGQTAGLTITSAPLPSGKVGVPYGGFHHILGHSFTGFPLSATGGVPPYTWTTRSLPPGLKITVLFYGGTTRCCLSIPVVNGTPTTAGNYNSVITVTDCASPPDHASANDGVNIQP